ncbi:MAG: DUF2726 domain-containing protein [Verrucomicrobia bacterium]|nr:DUF2726 domain-containing protein [Deltaproteobacteria bacterium]
MNILIIVAVIVIILAVLAALKAKQPAKDGELSFDTRDTLFSPAERSFLGVLGQSLDSRYRIFGKVRLGDLVKPVKGLSNSKRITALNKINQKHLDFVICSASDLAVIGVVELDDQSHGREDRAGRDAFVDQALATAKIPIAHFSAKRTYAIQDVRATLNESLKLASDSPTPIRVNEAAQVAQPVQQTKAEQPSAKSEVVAPVCPKCASVMVKRQAKNGSHAGNWFWACSAYPKCRQVVAIEEI